MSRYLIFIVATVCVASLCISSFAQAQTNRATEQTIINCTELLRDRTAASSAEDWPNLDRFARRFVKLCSDAGFDSEPSIAYAEIALANRQMNLLQETLDITQTCISAYYRSPGCHLEKAIVLINLSRIMEAKKSLDIAESVFKLLLDQTKIDYSYAAENSKRYLYEAKIEYCQSKLEVIKNIKSVYYND